ncbi:SixA phosphatase family protein [Ferrimonas marina]|uniref:Phosphohistidine phosphatase SixA n=1 Tax=Ferrimonas marina TaxID=299255 RepID=A0A1M5ZA51_9GAMM|nr:phosphoglycerate mutase family protein [Ferrimonas marina]SHI20773.1 Phosphohistidine phosphatase SixA [Ferrimonas marina]
MKRLVLIPLLLAALTGVLWLGWQTGQAEHRMLYLVRHAEKASGEDPDLLPCGRERAQQLGRWLTGRGIQAVYSSDTRRTRQTALLVADTLEVPVHYYDPRNLEALAETLLSAQGSLMVVGHSNTTPALASLLLAQEAPAMGEGDYDRVYGVHLGQRGADKLILERQPFHCP